MESPSLLNSDSAASKAPGIHTYSMPAPAREHLSALNQLGSNMTIYLPRTLRLRDMKSFAQTSRDALDSA